jgi:hypothetical protein
VARVALVVVGLLMYLCPATAAEQKCAPVATVIEQIGAMHPIDARITLDAEQAANVSTWWDKLEPVSDDRYNLIVILRHVNGQVGLLLGNDDLICRAQIVPQVGPYWCAKDG